MSDLDQLARAADAIDGQADQANQAAPAPGLEAGPPPVDPNLAAVGALLASFRELASAMLGVESLRVNLDQAKVDAVAAALAPVLTKYGVNLASALSGPELTAALVAGPILWNAGRQLHFELKAKKAKPVAEAPESAETAAAGV